MLALLVVAVMGCGQAEKRTALREEGVRSAMGEHWIDAARARDAAIEGDLARTAWLARRVGRALPSDDVGADLLPLRDDVVAAAERASQARDLAVAAVAIGEMAYGCGECHRAAHADVQVSAPRVAPAAPGIPEEMARHRQAIESLWAALVVPDDARREEATAVLAVAPLVPPGTAGAPLPPAAAELELGVHELAQQLDRSEGAERGRHYGELLTTCATCHRLFRH